MLSQTRSAEMKLVDLALDDWSFGSRIGHNRPEPAGWSFQTPSAVLQTRLRFVCPELWHRCPRRL